MGLGCSKRNVKQALVVPGSPFGRSTRFSRRNSIGTNGLEDHGPDSLLGLCLGVASESLPHLPLHHLRALPPDLAQLILDRMIQTGQLNDASILRLAGQLYYSIHLDAYIHPIRDFWLRYLATSALESAVIRRTTVRTHFLANHAPSRDSPI
jgi:hypothetical protein